MSRVVTHFGEACADYDAYLKSDWWRSMREWVLKTRHTCEKCGEKARPNFHVHHLTYDNVGHEGQEELMLLCPDCHSEEHGIKSEEPPESLAPPQRPAAITQTFLQDVIAAGNRSLRTSRYSRSVYDQLFDDVSELQRGSDAVRRVIDRYVLVPAGPERLLYLVPREVRK